jgi:hypothetical protein
VTRKRRKLKRKMAVVAEVIQILLKVDQGQDLQVLAVPAVLAQVVEALVAQVQGVEVAVEIGQKGKPGPSPVQNPSPQKEGREVPPLNQRKFMLAG